MAPASAVNFVVSLGAAVPNVVGLTQAAAQTAITTAGLTVGTVTTSNSATVGIGNVISQNPAAGDNIASGSAVALVVSLGAQVPNVVGSLKTNAQTALTTAGLTVGSGDLDQQSDGGHRGGHQSKSHGRRECGAGQCGRSSRIVGDGRSQCGR